MPSPNPARTSNLRPQTESSGHVLAPLWHLDMALPPYDQGALRALIDDRARLLCTYIARLGVVMEENSFSLGGPTASDDSEDFIRGELRQRAATIPCLVTQVPNDFWIRQNGCFVTAVAASLLGGANLSPLTTSTHDQLETFFLWTHRNGHPELAAVSAFVLARLAPEGTTWPARGEIQEALASTRLSLVEALRDETRAIVVEGGAIDDLFSILADPTLGEFDRPTRRAITSLALDDLGSDVVGLTIRGARFAIDHDLLEPSHFDSAAHQLLNPELHLSSDRAVALTEILVEDPNLAGRQLAVTEMLERLVGRVHVKASNPVSQQSLAARLVAFLVIGKGLFSHGATRAICSRITPLIPMIGARIGPVANQLGMPDWSDKLSELIAAAYQRHRDSDLAQNETARLLRQADRSWKSAAWQAVVKSLFPIITDALIQSGSASAAPISVNQLIKLIRKYPHLLDPATVKPIAAFIKAMPPPNPVTRVLCGNYDKWCLDLLKREAVKAKTPDKVLPLVMLNRELAK